MSPNNIKKPSFDTLYILKFPSYFTTWRLKEELKDGRFIFYTSAGDTTAPMSASRFDFLTKRYLVHTVALSALNVTSNAKISIDVAKGAFQSREYKPEDFAVDDIDSIEF